MADITDIERLNYYEGEYLGAVDFEAEQEYHRDMRRRHNIGPHTWGIITGLDIAQFPNGGANNEVDVYIQPGVAVDGFGREIALFGPYQLTADMFVDFPAKQSLSVWIGYTQQMLQPSSDSCASAGQSNAYSRVQESFQIVVDPIPPTSDPIVVAGNEVSPPTYIAGNSWTQPPNQPTLPTNEGDVILPFDDSVPFQALPDDNTTATWLVPLGQVLWDGPNQRFLQNAAPATIKGRQYAGAVASVLYAPAGLFTIQDRSTPSPLPTGATGVAAEVQGSLTVDLLLTAEADVWINGGELYFKDTGGANGDTVLGVYRIDGSSGGADLHIHIGDNSDPVNKPQHLTVGYGAAGSPTDTNVFTVGADGNVTIPAGSLSFGSQQAQILNLSGTNYGIGVQTSTLYFRSPSDFAFYVGGKYSVNQDDPGAGGSLSMKIDSSGDMVLGGALVIDNANDNNGQINPGLTFGLSSGEGISSKRTAGGNQYGLDFYTDFALRMSINNGGQVGIGTGAPDAQLNLGGGAWDLSTTEGDFKIGNDTYRLKMGVALGGGGAGDGRIRAAGGTNRLMLGTGTSDVLTITGTSVGINNTTPAFTLDVGGPISANGAISANGPMTANGSFSANGTISANGAISANGPITSSGIVHVGTNLVVTGNITAGGSKSGYVVDRFLSRAKKAFERGDVLVLHTRPSAVFYGVDNRIPIIEVSLATKAGDSRVCGIVDEPIVTADQTPGLDRKSIGTAKVGLMVTLGAYAYCKVDADIAPIEAGDLLTTSTTAGHAQKLDPEATIIAGSIIGKALATLEKGTGIIPILISHQ